MTLDEFKELKPGDKFWTSRTSFTSSDFIDTLGLELDTFSVFELEYKSTGVWFGAGYRLAWFDCFVGDKIVKLNTSELGHAFKDKDRALIFVFNMHRDLLVHDKDKETLKRLITEYPERFI